MPETPSNALVIDVSVAPRVNLALQQNHVPCVPRLALTNATGRELRDLQVTLTSWPAFVAPWSQRLDLLVAGQTHPFAPLDLQLQGDFLAEQKEREVGYLAVEVWEGQQLLASQRAPVEVLAPQEWGGVGVLPELLAAFVRPNAEALVPLLGAAASALAKTTGDGSLAGYQHRDPQRVVQMVRALYESVHGAGIGYINPPASFEQTGQKIRSHEQVLQGRLGTCLDLTVLLAALCEQVGLHPLLLLVQGHAFVGVWLVDFALQEPALDEPRPIQKRVELGEALVFDSSAVAQGASFAAARSAGEAYLRAEGTFVVAIDVRCARLHAVTPLPIDRAERVPTQRRQGAEAAEPGPGSGPRRAQEDAELSARLGLAGAAASAAVANAATNVRVERWKAKLLDLSMRNRLLNYRPGPKTLALPLVDLPKLEDALAADQALQLEPVLGFAALQGRLASDGGGLGEETQRAVLVEHQLRGTLHSNLAPAEHHKVLTELWRQSRAAMEESGAVVLYVALGMLEWFESPSSKAPRHAPILLVPVQLERSGAGWRLRRADDEARINMTLLKKLEADFGLLASGLEPLPEDEQGVHVAQVLHRMRQLVVSQPRWLVREEAAIGLFSFQKFLMWLDLQAKQAALMESPLVRHLLLASNQPFALAQPLVPEDELDARLPPQDTLHVVDADPSQMAAIAAAEAGSSFVLQGPPGTGKSQTITNLIAQLLYRGKTVLFVSEKRAALDVVHNRLSNVGLAPFCLELHSNAASKAEVMRQLREVFHVAEAHKPDVWQRHCAELSEVRDQLNAYAALLDQPSPFGLPTRGVLAYLFGHENTPRVTLGPLAMARLDAAKVAGHEHAVAALVHALGEAGGLAGHPFRAAGCTDWDPAWQRAVDAALLTLAERGRAAAAAHDAACAALQLPTATPAELVAAAAQAVLHTPGAPAVLLEPAGLGQRLQVLGGLVERGKALAERRSALQVRWDPQLWQQDLAPLRARLAQWAGAFFVLAFLMLWGVRSRLRPLARTALPRAPQLCADVDEASAQQAELTALGQSQLPQWLGPLWQGAETDWQRAAALAEWATQFAAVQTAVAAHAGSMAATARMRQLASDDAQLLAPGAKLAIALETLAPAQEAYLAAQAEVTALLSLDVARAIGPEATALQWATQADAWRTALPRLRNWCAAAAALSAADARGLAPLRAAHEAGEVALAQLPACLARSLREAWWEARLQAEPLLRSFRGATHGQTIQRFRTLDREAQLLARAEVRGRLAALAPSVDAPGEEMGLLRRQLQLQRRHMPIRKLFAQIPTTLRRLKPCVLMSPLSVAQYLDASLPGFDVVVFDEASQIPAWDAVGAIARGKQLIVVGDSKQLPPTSFFDRAADSDEDAELDDEDVLDTESILDELVAARVHELLLKWHYRSKHESLIAFSNWHYYENRLHTFPSSADRVPELGVHLRKVQGHYDRGGSRTNRAEAEAVVQELFALLALPDGERPSVGVVTFSQVQQRLVQDLIDARLQREPGMQRFFADSTAEPVFIKNLENVQGDERDVMLFGLGYGKDQAGKMTMNFGPLNRQGGERRLNVAVTRARRRLLVFTTIDWSDIDDHRSRAVGVQHLKAFLRYAALGPQSLLSTAIASDRAQFGSPFEAEVCQTLTNAGWTVHPQVGCSGYRIDLAVADPDRPGTYVLGVECDGATYHGSRVARERDRLRESVLVSLGWRIARVWSTDWWYDRETAERTLLAEVEAAVAAARARPGSADARPTDPAPPAEALSRAESSVDGSRAAPRPPLSDAAGFAALLQQQTAAWPPDAMPFVPAAYVGPPAGEAEAFYRSESDGALMAALAATVATHGPLLRSAAQRLVAQAWGLDRAGAQIQRRLQALADVLPLTERPVLRGDFWWPPQRVPAAWQGFRYVPVGEGARTLTEVAPEELANAAQWVIQRALVISTQELAAEVARTFGMRKVTQAAVDTVTAALPLLVQSGRAQSDGERWRPVE